MNAEQAERIAWEVLSEPLPQRWAHTRGVAAQASSLAAMLGSDADLVPAAAWLHDIGYSPGLVVTGFHPLDGARYLRDTQRAGDGDGLGAGEVLCRLVAHHSCAIIEAGERGLEDALRGEFEPPPDDLANALIYCDMTTDPQGAVTTVDRRLSDIYTRYGEGHVITRSIKRAAPLLKEATETVAKQLTNSHRQLNQ